jgi:ribosome-associated protein
VKSKTNKTRGIRAPNRSARAGADLRSAAQPATERGGPSAEARKMALAAAQAGLDKKAMHVEIVDVTGKVDYADYLVLMTGHSDRHVAAIAESVDVELGKQGMDAISIEGLPSGQWVLIDFVDVVVHVFQEETRSLYDLDGLWLDARRIPVPGTAPELP